MKSLKNIFYALLLLSFLPSQSSFAADKISCSLLYINPMFHHMVDSIRKTKNARLIKNREQCNYLIKKPAQLNGLFIQAKVFGSDITMPAVVASAIGEVTGPCACAMAF